MRGVMRSAARLTYARAQAAFDGNPDADMTATVKKTLADVWAAYKSLTIARQQARARWTSTCRNGASCWAPTARSPPSPIASGWNP